MSINATEHALPMKLKDGERHVFPTVTRLVYKRNGKPLENEDGAIEMDVANAHKLGNQLPDYYAKQSDYETLVSETNPQASKDAELLNGKAPEYYLPAVNLLDNPDFAIASMGYGGYIGAQKYAADRWRDMHRTGVYAYENGRLSISPGSAEACMSQKLSNVERLIGKSLTFAIKSTADMFICSSVFDGVNRKRTYLPDGQSYIEITVDSVQIVVFTGTLETEWAALYEGTYTTDTLPPFVSTHPRVENLKLGNAVQPRNLLDNPDFAVAQAGYGGLHGSRRYAADRWISSANISAPTATTGIQITGAAWNAGLRQAVAQPNRQIGKTLTLAVRMRSPQGRWWMALTANDANGNKLAQAEKFAECGDKTVSVVSLIIPTGTEEIRVTFDNPNSSEGTVEIDWVALYEGSFTAETLPPYVSTHPRVENLKLGNAVQPRNLLDNPDFAVAQAGYNGYHGTTKYLCDRWISRVTTVTKLASGIRFDVATGGFVYQILTGVAGKTLTMAMKTTGTGELHMSVYSTDLSTCIHQIWGYADSNGIFAKAVTMPSDVDSAAFIVYPTDGDVVSWVALYPGTYTAETLPPFVPRPYAVELAECQWYFYRIKGRPYAIVGTGMVRTTTETSVFVSLPPMRDLPDSTPTVSSNGAFSITTAAGVGVVQDITIDSWANSSQGVVLNMTHTAISAVGQAAVMQFSNDGSAYIDFSRDLQ